MADPFLLAHEVEPLLFDIGGPRAPIAIRDQMVRARYLIERLRHAGLVARGSHVLIVGAGAAGVTAALDAVSHGLLVTLIDALPLPFQLQARCRTRWIDPTQYDWPQPHWHVARWPVSSRTRGFPLPFIADRADRLARSWSSTLALARAGLAGRLHVRPHTKLAAWPTPVLSPAGLVIARDAQLLPSGGAMTMLQAAAVVLARGFGTERCVVEDNPPRHGRGPARYESSRFWDTDPYESHGMGLSVTAPSIVVSGGGDGALQDFLRLVTGLPSAAALLHRLTADPKVRDAIAIVRTTLAAEEDQAQRALLWSGTTEHDHDVLERLHGAHRSTVDAIVRSSVWPIITSALARLVGSRNVLGIEMTHSCTHFPAAYALNRFLVLLVARWLETQRTPSPLRSGVRLVRVDPAAPGHVCTGGCWGPSHVATFVPHACLPGTAPSGSIAPLSYDGIVVRHGIEPHALAAGAARRVVRQSPPYHYP